MRVLKNKLCLEKYLCTNSNYLGRVLHSSIRNGSNFLEIEKGRWKRLAVESRLCKQCDSKEVETEIHFVTQCTHYNELRQKLFQIIFEVSQGKWDLNKIEPKTMFILLMNGTGDEFEQNIFMIFQAYLVKFRNSRIED